ncbi:MAG: (Fe-S)-binding protein [Dehalobacterium sp.]
MDSSAKLRQLCQEMIDNCTGCNLCATSCPLLNQINENPGDISKREPALEEAYSCTLCGLCDAVCPSSLSMKRIFAETRVKAVDRDEIDINEYRYMFPDRKNNVMSLYREVNNISYTDLKADQEGPVAFFPGCSMLTYAPELTRKVFRHLEEEYPGLILITDCCGLPFYQLGFKSRGNDYVNSLKKKLKNLKVQSLVTACPNCYYQLGPMLKEAGINLKTIYEALPVSNLLETIALPTSEKQRVAVHDSCPDRFNGIFARESREALVKMGYTLVEMEHNRSMTMCCGSGGQVTHFQPELAQNLVEARLKEAEDTGADILAAYCLGCILNFTKITGKQKKLHVLNLLLDFEMNYQGIKEKSRRMFEGPEGQAFWERIMTEE